MKAHLVTIVAATIFLITAAVQAGMAAQVLRNDGKVIIIDRTGYEWNVTQAVELGFKPDEFQFGIGKDAFDTLDDDDLGGNRNSLKERSRVIGVEIEGSAHAYSVTKLRYHEIANTTLAGRPIVAGY